MAAFVSDTFTDTAGTALASHTGEVGAAWSLLTDYVGTIIVTDANRIRAASDSVTARYITSGTPATNEYDVDVDLRVLTTVDSFVAGVLGRAVQTDGGGYEAWYNTSTELWTLSAAGSPLGTFAQTLSVATTYHLKLEIRTATKKLYVDGVERISSATNTITQTGNAGIWIFQSGPSNSVGVHLDNFTASDPAAPPAGLHFIPQLDSLVRPFNMTAGRR